MTADFYGRARELGELRDELDLALSTRRARVVMVQGRRQVGKSTLTERFAETSDVRYASLTGMKGTAESIQVERAAESIRSSRRPIAGWDIYNLTTPSFNWMALVSMLGFAVGDEPAVVVFDEFPWANETAPGLDGLLKASLDSRLGEAPVLLVLVGSDEAMMEQLITHDRPLFGKINRRIVLEPFDPAETADALGSDRGAMEVFDTRLVTGGLPGLVEQVRRFPTATEFVRDALRSPSSSLVDWARLRLAAELSDSENASVVLSAVGADEIGVTTFSRIVGVLGGGPAAQTAVTRATDLLSKTKRILAVDLPAGNPHARLKRYRIDDSYLRFWFRFVEPHQRSIEVGRSDLAIDAFDTAWPTWRGKAIEPIVREGVTRLCRHLGDPFRGIEEVGGWWDRKGVVEIDLVGMDSRRSPVAIGSIKWRDRHEFDSADLADLAAGRSAIPKAGAAKLVAVCPAGIRSGVSVDLGLRAHELLDAWRPD